MFLFSASTIKMLFIEYSLSFYIASKIFNIF